MNSIITRTLCVALAALALAAAMPTPDAVVPEQELAQSKYVLDDSTYEDIYDDEDNGQIKDDQKKDDTQDGVASEEANHLGGHEASKDADAIAKKIADEKKKDEEAQAKEDAMMKERPDKEDTLRTMVEAFGKKETEPGKKITYWEELQDLIKKRKEIAAKKAAALAKRDAEREKEIRKAMVADDKLLGDAFAKAHKDDEEYKNAEIAHIKEKAAAAKEKADADPMGKGD